MSVLKLAKIINTKEQSAKKYQEERWKRGFGCVKCGSIRAWKHRKLKNGLQKYRCEDCKHVFSDQSTTILRWNKAKIHSVAVIRHLASSKMSIRDIASEAEVNKNTAERLRSVIRKVSCDLYQSISPNSLSGVVEMDETMIGKHWFWGALERETGRAVVEMVPDRTEVTLDKNIWKYVEEGSSIMTDEWGGYNPNPRFFSHYTVNHSKYFVLPECRLIHTNSIEGLWRQLKRKINHFCNGVKLDNITTYINEYFYIKNCNQNKKPTFFPLYCEKT